MPNSIKSTTKIHKTSKDFAFLFGQIFSCQKFLNKDTCTVICPVVNSKSKPLNCKLVFIAICDF